MRLTTLIIRNLRRRPLATSLTTISIALGVGLFATIGAMRSAAQSGFERTAGICDLVVGAKGSPLELVLSSLYHVGQSPGNIPFKQYEQCVSTKGVEWVVPVLVGDSFRGRRIVGTTDALFHEMRLGGHKKPLGFSEGAPFVYSQDQFSKREKGRDLFVAVVGSEAAHATGLSLGKRFIPAHDLEGGPSAKQHRDAEMEVVGVLSPTGTPIDRGIYIPAGAFYQIKGHRVEEQLDHNEHGDHDEHNDEADHAEGWDRQGVSALLVRTKPGYYHLRAWRQWNEQLTTQAAQPAVEIRKLFQLVGQYDRIMRWLAGLVVVVALMGTMVAIYNTMTARRKEFAVLRALGAKKRVLLFLLMGESAVIAMLGSCLGLILAGILVWLSSSWISLSFGISVSASPGLPEALLVLVTTCAGAFAGLVPAVAAYRTEPVRHLSSSAVLATLLLPLALSSCSQDHTSSSAEVTEEATGETGGLRDRVRKLGDGVIPIQTDGPSESAAETDLPEALWWDDTLLDQLVSEIPSDEYKLLVSKTLGGLSGPEPIPLGFDFLGAWRFNEEAKQPFPKHVSLLDGKRVRMVGFMLPDIDFEDIRDFHLVRSLWGCCFGAPPRVNELVRVHLPEGKGVDYTYNTLELVGKLRVTFEMEDGLVLDLYHLDVDVDGFQEIDYFDPEAPSDFDPNTGFQGVIPTPEATPAEGPEIGY